LSVNDRLRASVRKIVVGATFAGFS
jgi:hypothetical protein